MPRVVLLRIEGRVQGVGYRDWAVATGRELGLHGWVRNRADGSVEAMVWGAEAVVDVMIQACWRGPAAARVDKVDIGPADAASLEEGFVRRPTA